MRLADSRVWGTGGGGTRGDRSGTGEGGGGTGPVRRDSRDCGFYLRKSHFLHSFRRIAFETPSHWHHICDLRQRPSPIINATHSSHVPPPRHAHRRAHTQPSGGCRAPCVAHASPAKPAHRYATPPRAIALPRPCPSLSPPTSLPPPLPFFDYFLPCPPLSSKKTPTNFLAGSCLSKKQQPSNNANTQHV
jgi:hypothetical protein